MLTRFLSFVRDYFGFSHKESRGFLVLLFLILLFLALPFLYRLLSDRQPVDTSAADQQKLDSLVALMKAEEARQPRYSQQRARETTTTEQLREPSLFRFDPNTISVAGWQQLGLPRWLAERIDKYRSKGGRFRKKEDLLRIYDFPPDLYDDLEPYIVLTTGATTGGNPYPAPTAPRSDQTARTDRADATDPARADRPTRVAPQPFDINTADTSQLVALKGIGPTLAARIVKYRDALGGFISQNQFEDVYGLDSLALVELRRLGQIRSAPRRIPVNTATAEQLDRLPFLSRRQAQVIVSYREQHGAYTSAESLRPIRILDAKTIEKLTPYLDF
ncbi:helix-hairpin-helix domain-containing protein [Spirosoma sordidisoli]|uniref:Helix-hairpin-helix domain-containing protein n=1 Tax=Spirosoma sordidisoli TaxID=2502893 RepID=A0A4Q2UP87_9BACT|nr:helix-hairpin-helix domain-containing protein [Spirosoma sordidisoli]RYC69415.1 helix-hairpin-helix domain-containing protein [Spirosoma sordidisoli]